MAEMREDGGAVGRLVARRPGVALAVADRADERIIRRRVGDGEVVGSDCRRQDGEFERGIKDVVVRLTMRPDERDGHLDPLLH